MSELHQETVQRSNDNVISKLGLPRWLAEEIAESQKEEEKISNIKATAQRYADTSALSLSTLDKIISQVDELETTLMPLYNESKKVILAQTHISQTLQEVTAIRDNLELVHRAESSFTAERIQSDYQSYLSWLSDLQVAHSFWTRNSSFKHADRTLRHLRDILSKASQGVADEFERVLGVYTRPVDVSVLIHAAATSLVASYVDAGNGSITGTGVGMGTGMSMGMGAPAVELIPSVISARLSTLAQGMDGTSSRQYLFSLTKLRGATLKASAKRTIAAASGDAASAGAGMGFADRFLALTTGLGVGVGLGGVNGVYTPGSHRILLWMECLLVLFEEELRLWQSVVAGTAVDREEFDNAFGGCLIDAVDAWSKRLEAALKDEWGTGERASGASARDRLMVALDILGYLQRNQQRFRMVLRRTIEHPDPMGRIADLKAFVHILARDAIVTVVAEGVGGGEVGEKNGTVCAMTVETTALIAALAQFRSVLQTLPPEDVVDALAALDHSHTQGGSGSSSGSAGGSGVSGGARGSAASSFTKKNAAGVELRLLAGNADRTSTTATGNTPNTYVAVDEAVGWAITKGLERRLEARAGKFKNPVLSALFLLNNYHHMAQSVERTTLKREAFHSHLEVSVQRARHAYLDATWSNLLQSINLADKDAILSQCSATNVPTKAKNAIKKMFTAFNTGFVSIVSQHSHYAVPDANLRGQLRADHIDIIIPRYKAFIDTYAQLPFTTKPSKYIMFKVDVVESTISKFYDDIDESV